MQCGVCGSEITNTKEPCPSCGAKYNTKFEPRHYLISLVLIGMSFQSIEFLGLLSEQDNYILSTILLLALVICIPFLVKKFIFKPRWIKKIK